MQNGTLQRNFIFLWLFEHLSIIYDLNTAVCEMVTTAAYSVSRMSDFAGLSIALLK